MTEPHFASFGEVMLRLAPSGKKRIAQALPGGFEATFGGGEANVGASLAYMGATMRYLTALPDNPIARACARQLAGLGVDVSRILYEGSGRMGVYYVEHGSGPRGSNVYYDREHSVIATLGPERYDFPRLLDGVTHLHLTGITPALSEAAARSTLAAAEAATQLGATLSVDLNFRKKLWRWETGTPPAALAGRIMEGIVRLADVIVGNEEDAADVFGLRAGDSSADQGRLDRSGYAEVARQMAAKFPKARTIAITLRASLSAEHNNWGALLLDVNTGRVHFAPTDNAGEYAPYELRNIVDRFGGGDSFCAGLLYALNDAELSEPSTALRFAVAASALKHTLPGDYNYSSRDEALALMKGGQSGRVMR